jgi:hypothetical protein
MTPCTFLQREERTILLGLADRSFYLMRFIWALELKEKPNEEWIKVLKEVFTNKRFAPPEKPPENWKIFLKNKTAPKNIKEWKEYADRLIKYYLYESLKRK